MVNRYFLEHSHTILERMSILLEVSHSDKLIGLKVEDQAILHKYGFKSSLLGINNHATDVRLKCPIWLQVCILDLLFL